MPVIIRSAGPFILEGAGVTGFGVFLDDGGGCSTKEVSVVLQAKDVSSIPLAIMQPVLVTKR